MYALIEYDPDFTIVQLGKEDQIKEKFESTKQTKGEGVLWLVKVTDPENFMFVSGRGTEVVGGELLEEYDPYL